MVDICNGRSRLHRAENALDRQTQLLETLNWSSNRRILHKKMLSDQRASEYNFFADETWFLIKLLLFGHITAIDIFYVGNGEKINPRLMNTDTIE